jgi:hypothetical protein
MPLKVSDSTVWTFTFVSLYVISNLTLLSAQKVSPRAFLPVQLIEGRIAKDLCTNLIAIRKHVSKKEHQKDLLP